MKELIKAGKKGKSLGKLPKLNDGSDFSNTSPLSSSIPPSTDPSRSRERSRGYSIATSSRSVSSVGSSRGLASHDNKQSSTYDEEEGCDSTPTNLNDHASAGTSVDYLSHTEPSPLTTETPADSSRHPIPCAESHNSSISTSSDASIFTSISSGSTSSRSSVASDEISNTSTPIYSTKQPYLGHSDSANGHAVADDDESRNVNYFSSSSKPIPRRQSKGVASMPPILQARQQHSFPESGSSSPRFSRTESRKTGGTSEVNSFGHTPTPKERPVTPSSNPGTPTTSLSTQTQLASLRGALEAARIREEKSKSDIEQCMKEVETLRWEQSSWRHREMEVCD